MKKTYDEYEKYDVNKDEEFLRALANENAFAYYLIKSNQKRPYNKKGIVSNKAGESLAKKLTKGVGKHLAKRAVKGVASAALTGAMIGVRPMLVQNSVNLTRKLISKNPKMLNAVMNKSGVYRV